MKHDFNNDAKLVDLAIAWHQTPRGIQACNAFDALTQYINKTVREMHDVDELYTFFKSLQNYEMSVSRARELLAMWLAGNYHGSMLPVPEVDKLEEIDRLKERIAELEKTK